MRTTLLALALFCGALAGCAGPRFAEAPADAPQGTLAEVKVAVYGMSCPIRCPEEVKDQLRAVPGVRSVTVDFEDKSATCRVVPGTETAAVVAGLHDPYSGALLW